MALSDLQQAQVSTLLSPLCKSPALARVADQLRHGFQIRGNEIELFASRPGFRSPHAWENHPVAKFKYIGTRRVWQLYCVMRDLKWHRYEPRFESPDLATLVKEVEKDPTGIFWG